jgi:hypothetical protein
MMNSTQMAVDHATVASGTNRNKGAFNMNSRHNSRRPDLLFILVLIVSLGVFVSTGASAAESLFSKEGLGHLIDGDMKLARVGSQGAGLHMTFKSPSRENNAVYISSADNYSSKDSGVHLSVRMPW